MKLFWSDLAEMVDFNSESFKLLFSLEKDIIDHNGFTAAMHLCK